MGGQEQSRRLLSSKRSDCAYHRVGKIGHEDIVLILQGCHIAQVRTVQLHAEDNAQLCGAPFGYAMSAGKGQPLGRRLHLIGLIPAKDGVLPVLSLAENQLETVLRRRRQNIPRSVLIILQISKPALTVKFRCQKLIF
ncbi:MAG: hypothetical protein ACOX64_12060 [Candidatus Merdivicinus sp.]